MKLLKFLAVLALAFAAVAVRGVHLTADPPDWLSWSAGIYSDEGFYAGDAQHVALTGHWAPGDFHGALVSPTLYGLELVAFRLMGPGLRAARLVSALCGCLSILLLFAALRRLYNERVAWAGAVLLSFSAPYVLYNRLALMETPAAMCLCAALALLAYAEDDKAPPASGGRGPRSGKVGLGFAVLAAAMYGLALVTKVLAAGAGVALAAWCGRGKGQTRWIWALVGVAIPVAVTALMVTEPYMARLQAMDRFYLWHQFLPRSATGLLMNLERNTWTGKRDGLLPALIRLDPALTVLGGLGVLVALTRRRPGDLMLLGWLVPMAIGFACLSYAPTRYDVLLLPALAGAGAAVFVNFNLRLVGVLCAAYIALQAVTLGRCLEQPQYTVMTAAARLAQVEPAQAPVIGQFAPELALAQGTGNGIMIEPGLANDVSPIGRLHVRMILVTRAPYWEHWWCSEYPWATTPGNLACTLRIGPNLVVDGYRVPAAANFMRLYPHGHGGAGAAGEHTGRANIGGERGQ